MMELRYLVTSPALVVIGFGELGGWPYSYIPTSPIPLLAAENLIGCQNQILRGGLQKKTKRIFLATPPSELSLRIL